MKRKEQPPGRRCAFSIVVALAMLASTGISQADEDEKFEVWALDQSNSPGKAFGGTLHIYSGQDLVENAAAARPKVIHLGGGASTLCLSETGANPVRPHIVSFNNGASHAIISFVASGHVLFLDAATREAIKCLRMTLASNGARQAHAAFAAPNNKYVIVANQNGKLLERINTDANGNGTPYESAADIELDAAAALNLAACVTPNGVACETPGISPRPNNSVICPIVDRSSTLTFATLAGGGMLVVDTSTGGVVPPIVAEYDNSAIHPNGCGGMQRGTLTDSRIYFNSGAGGTNFFESDLYSLPLAGFPAAPAFNAPNTPAPTLVFSFDTEGHDSHGMVLTLKRHQRFLWVADRGTNMIEVADTKTDTHVGSFSLVTSQSADPAPDLLDIAPNGAHVFVSLRGPCPLTANISGVNNAVGATPGVGVVKINGGGRTGKLKGIAPINSVDHSIMSCAPGGAPASNNRADVHGIAVRALPKKDSSKD